MIFHDFKGAQRLFFHIIFQCFLSNNYDTVNGKFSLLVRLNPRFSTKKRVKHTAFSACRQCIMVVVVLSPSIISGGGGGHFSTPCYPILQTLLGVTYAWSQNVANKFQNFPDSRGLS